MKSASFINAMRQHILTQADVASIRIEILEFLFHSLKERKDSFGEWEKAHFSSAITALTLNIHAARQPTCAWLELCLSDLEKAITPAQSRDPNYRSPGGSVVNARHEQLMDAVICLRREIDAGILPDARVA